MTKKIIIKAKIKHIYSKAKKMTPHQRAKLLRNASAALNLILPFIAIKGKKRLMLLGAGVLLDRFSKIE
jgi:hypothetical protein